LTLHSQAGEESSDDEVTMDCIDAQKGEGAKKKYRVRWTDEAITWETAETVQGTRALEYFLWEPVVKDLSEDLTSVAETYDASGRRSKRRRSSTGNAVQEMAKKNPVGMVSPSLSRLPSLPSAMASEARRAKPAGLKRGREQA